MRYGARRLGPSLSVARCEPPEASDEPAGIVGKKSGLVTTYCDWVIPLYLSKVRTLEMSKR